MKWAILISAITILVSCTYIAIEGSKNIEIDIEGDVPLGNTAKHPIKARD